MWHFCFLSFLCYGKIVLFCFHSFFLSLRLFPYLVSFKISIKGCHASTTVRTAAAGTTTVGSHRVSAPPPSLVPMNGGCSLQAHDLGRWRWRACWVPQAGCLSALIMQRHRRESSGTTSLQALLGLHCSRLVASCACTTAKIWLQKCSAL